MLKKITRRVFCSMLVALPFPAYAQQPGKNFRIGFLDVSTPSGMAVLIDAFRQELSKLGWIEGENITRRQNKSATRFQSEFWSGRIR